MRRFTRPYRVNTMYGADGKLRTSYFEGDAARAARKNVKAFNKELAKYDKDFINYASLDIEDSKLNDKNTRYIFGKLGIAEGYVNYIPAGDMAESMGDDTVAIAGNKSAYKLGVGAKIAGVFQPFLEKQAAQHPHLKSLSDRVTKAANGGRMPLTAESAAVMKIAFDKKYYNDCRRPGADKDALRAQYNRAVRNLTEMAEFDGVSRKEFSDSLTKKLIYQMQVDETITDIYKGMSTGDIRFAPDEPVKDKNGKDVKINGRVLYKRSDSFVDKNGEAIDSLNLMPREPQSVDVILREYQEKLTSYASKCRTEAEFKRMLATDSYRNIERDAKAFAMADCPDEAEKFKHDFTRANLLCCKKWALAHDSKSPYAQLEIPPKFDDLKKNEAFFSTYATDDYYDIDSVGEKASRDILYLTNAELEADMKKSFENDAAKISDIDAITERLNKLEAENAELRRQLNVENDKIETPDVSDDEIRRQKEKAEKTLDSRGQRSQGNALNGIDEKDILEMAEKIRQNEQENETFSKSLDNFFNNTQPPLNKSITIGDTPNALVMAGADANKPLIIRPATIIKVTGNPNAVFHGHALSKDNMTQLLDEIRNPVLILKGSHDKSLVAITELDDEKGNKIIVPVELDSKNGRHEVNRITSAYGKKNIANYLNTQANINHNLIACNKEKADKMFQSLGLQLPPEETFISFDNSIAYSTANVKYPEQNFSKPTSTGSGNNYTKNQAVVGHTDQTVKTEDKQTVKIEKSSQQVKASVEKTDTVKPNNDNKTDSKPVDSKAMLHNAVQDAMSAALGSLAEKVYSNFGTAGGTIFSKKSSLDGVTPESLLREVRQQNAVNAVEHKALETKHHYQAEQNVIDVQPVAVKAEQSVIEPKPQAETGKIAKPIVEPIAETITEPVIDDKNAASVGSKSEASDANKDYKPEELDPYTGDDIDASSYSDELADAPDSDF